MHRFAVLIATSAALLGGCGSDNPRMIPEDDAQALLATVDRIDSLVTSEECAQAAARVDEARAQVDELPGRVSRSLKRNLRAWVEQIDDRLPRDCQPEEEKTPTPVPTPEETETPKPTATPEETATPTTTPSPEETATPEPTITVEPGTAGGVDGGEEN